MELKDFIAEAISQVIEGIDAVHEKRKDDNANRVILFRLGSNGADNYDRVQEITFEVSIGIENTGKKGMGGKIRVLGIEVGGDKETGSKIAHENKIKFSIPICFTQR
jgi:hypothetical protein